MKSYEKHLLRDPRFWPLFWTQFLGAFNDNVFKNALVILITYKAYHLFSLTPAQMVALCGGIFILPFFLFSAYAGQIADKFEKHSLMVWIKVWEIAVMGMGAFGFYFENIHLLMVTLFMMGLQSTFFGPIKYSALPELITDDELVHGNALVEMGTFLAILLGTILGGVLIAQHATGPLMVAAITILIACLGTLCARYVHPLTPRNPNLKIHHGLIRPTWEILKISTHIKSVWNCVLGISWFWLLGAVLLSMFPVYAKDVLHADESVVTLFLALFSIGVATGSILCEKLSRERLELGLVPFGSIGMSIFMLDLFISGTPRVPGIPYVTLTQFLMADGSFRILMDLFGLSLFSGFFIVPLYTFIQHRAHPDKLSRTIAANNVLNALFMVAGSILLAALYGFGVTVIEIFLIFGILNMVVALYIYTVIPEFLLRFVCVILTRLIYRLNVQGLNHVPEEGAAVLVCNHVTFVDWLIISAAVKRPIRFVMYYKFHNIPVLRFFLRGGKVIPIAGAKEDTNILENAMVQIRKELKLGNLVCIFPEGQVTHDGQLNPYRQGIEKIIQKTPVPVIPMTLHGLWGSYFSRKYGSAASKPWVIFKTIWSNVNLHILPPLPAYEVTAPKLEHITRTELGRNIVLGILGIFLFLNFPTQAQSIETVMNGLFYAQPYRNQSQQWQMHLSGKKEGTLSSKLSYALQAKALLHFPREISDWMDIPEAYIQYTRPQTTVSFGRKKKTWGNHALYSPARIILPTFEIDPLRQEKSGIFALTTTVRERDTELEFFYSPLFIPDLGGVRFQQSQNRFEILSRWSTPLFYRIKIGDTWLPLSYDLHIPELSDVLLKQSLGLRFQQSTPSQHFAFWFSYFHNPKSKLQHDAKLHIEEEGLKSNVNLYPIFIPHIGFGFETLFPVASLGALFEIALMAPFQDPPHIQFLTSLQHPYFEIGFKNELNLTQKEEGLVQEPVPPKNFMFIQVQKRLTPSWTIQSNLERSLLTNEWVFQPKAAFDWKKNIVTTVGADILYGVQNTFWGNFREYDRVWFETKVTF